MENFNKTTKSDIYKIDPRNIVVQEGFNSRTVFNIDELAEQIKEVGVLNPITVTPFKDEEGVEKYRLVDGERRYRACMKLISEGVEIARVPALYASKSLKPEDLLVQQLMRNEGKAFTEYELGIAYKKFIDYGWTIAQISEKVKKCAGCIQYALENLEKDERVQALMRDGKITGAEVRKFYQLYGGENKDSIQAILDGESMREASGAETITIGLVKKVASNKDKKTKEVTNEDLLAKAIAISEKTVSVKDTAKIREGFKIFLNYLSDVQKKNPDAEIELDLIDIYGWLNNNKGKSISALFDEMLKKEVA